MSASADFVLMLPAWVIINRPAHPGTSCGAVRLAYDAKKYGLFLPLYTDNDLGRRAIDEQGMTGVALLGMRTPAALLDVLRQCRAAGVHHVAFDPSTGPPAKAVFRPISTVIESMEETHAD